MEFLTVQDAKQAIDNKSSLLNLYIKPTNTIEDKAINIRSQRWLLALLPCANKKILIYRFFIASCL